RISEEERMHEEEEADELYRDVDINQGMGLQVSHDIDDSHVTLTPVHSDGQQESSSTSSFVTSLLNSIIDPCMESIFTTGSSSVTPIPSPKYTMTPSIITTTKTASQPPIPPTPIPSDILQTLLTFELVFLFEDRVKSLEVNFSEFMRTHQSPEAVSNIPADLSEMELKKILIDKIEGNKSIQRSNEQWNLYKALVDAYEADKTILDSYGESAILKRRREDDDDQEGPSAGSEWGSKRRREGREHASASTLSELATTSAGRSTTGTQSRQMFASESAFEKEPMQTTCQMDEPSHPVFETGAEDQPIVQTSQHPEWFSRPRKPPTPDRDWNKTLPAVQGNAQLWISALAKQTDARSSFNKLLDTPINFSNFIMNRLSVDTLTPEFLAGPTYELMRGSCNSLTELEYHLEEVYKATIDQLDWDNPEGDFKRLRLQDIKDMLVLLVQGKLSNLTVEELESYQKRLNLTNPDTYRSDLKRCEAYMAYSNPRGFIYQNKDKKNRLMRIDELHKFSDGTLNDVRNALNDRLKGIRMQYLPTTIWRKGDMDRATAMIQAIDKMLKTRRIVRSLERFLGGRQYEGDFRMLQRTI
nr:hypothetical protein [Tanacetum cinerariifolium]